MNVNTMLKSTIFFGIFAILFVPFIVANLQFFPFITGKGFVFRITIEIIFAVWIFLFIRDRSYMPKFSWITGAALIFLGIITLADILGANPYKSFWSNYERMEGLISLIHLFLYFLVVSSMLKTEKLWKIFLNISLVSSILITFYGFFQLAGKIVINQGGVRVDATFGNATYLAVYMLINMFFAVFLFVRAREKLYLKFIYGIAFILQGIILYQTATRGAILGLIGGVAVSALLVILFARGEKKARISSLVVLAVIFAIVLGFFAIRNTDFVKRSQTLGRFASLSADGIKSQGRYFVWPIAWQGFKEHPILGWGQENFSYVFNEHYKPEMYTQEPWFDRTHDIFLDWLIAGGLLGFLAYWAMYAALLFYLWRGKNNFSIIDKSVLTGLVAAYVFQNIFVFDNLISYVLFFSLLAFIHAMSVESKEPIKWISKMMSNSQVAERIATPIILIAIASSLYFLNVKPIIASRTLLRAIDPGVSTPVQSLENFKKVFAYNTFGSAEAREQLLPAVSRFAAENIPLDTKSDFVKMAKEQMLIQVNATPLDTRYLFFMGGLLSRIGENQEAIKYFERAIKTSPGKQNLYFGLGGAYIGIGPTEFPKALEIFKKAYDLEPKNTEAVIIYAIGAIYNGNNKLASDLLSPLDVSRVVFDDRVLSAYLTTAQYGQVVKILETRVKIDPKNAQIRFQLAAAYFQVGNKTASVGELREAIKIDPKIQPQAEYFINEIQAGRNPLQ